MKPTSALRSFLLGSSLPTAIAAFSLFNSRAHAGTTWDGGSLVDSKTSTAANWNGDVRPNTSPLTFAGTVRNTVIWDGINTAAPMNITGITFSATAGAFQLNQGTQAAIQFVANSTSTILNSSSNLQTLNIASKVFYNGTKTFDAGGSGLALTGGIVFRGDSMISGETNQLDLIGGATNSTTSSVSREGAFAVGATTSLVKNGTGKWTITGNVTDTGTTTITQGTLEYQGSVSSSGITNNSALIFNNAATQSYANVISGSGTLTKNGAGSLTLSNSNTYTGTTTISGGTLSAGKIVVSSSNSSLGNAASAVTLGAAGSQGTLSYTGNTAAYTRGFTIGGAGGGRLDVTTSGQTLTVQTGHVTGSGLFTVGGAGNTSITSNLTHTGGLTKADAGTLTLSGTNTYTGATTVSAGILAVNGSLANTTTTIGAGTPNTGTLQGSGTIGGSVTIENGGTLAPGNSIESLGTGALSFLASSTYAYELNTSLYAGTPNEAGDLTFSSGTLDIAAGAILTLTDLGTSTALAVDSKLTLISYISGWTAGELFSYDAGSGLTTLANNSVFTLGANQWRFSYDDQVGEGVNYTANSSGKYVTMTVVPEPRAALLGGLGMLMLLRRRRI